MFRLRYERETSENDARVLPEVRSGLSNTAFVWNCPHTDCLPSGGHPALEKNWRTV